MLREVDRLLQLYDGDRELMWEHYVPYARPKRRARINNAANENGFGLLNGQAGFLNMVQQLQLPLESLDTLVLLTDGFVSTARDRHESSDHERQTGVRRC